MIAPLIELPMLSCGYSRMSSEFGKLHADRVYIRTAAYLNLRKVSTVKKLLEVASMLLLAVLLSSDDRVTTAGDFLELRAIENPYGREGIR